MREASASYTSKRHERSGILTSASSSPEGYTYARRPLIACPRVFDVPSYASRWLGSPMPGGLLATPAAVVAVVAAAAAVREGLVHAQPLCCRSRGWKVYSGQ